MSKVAYLHTFHSQVAETLLNVDFWPDIILSFDAHVDSNMGVRQTLDTFPPDIRLIALRGSAHTYIRNAMGGTPLYIRLGVIDFDEEDNPLMYLIIPRKTFLVEVETNNRNYQRVGKEPIHERGQKRTLENGWAIKIFESPPKNLGKFFVKNMFLEYDSVWDIDIDYFSELQRECFSPFTAVQNKFLGKIPRVLKLIRKYQPGILTISEMKNDALNDSKSRFSKFLKRIKELGYEIDYTNIIEEEDTELISKLKLYEKFTKEIQKPLQLKYSYSREDKFNEELINEITRFFKK